MSLNPRKKKQAKVLRTFRKVHRINGATLFIFFFVVSISGLLLGWKKNSNDYLLSKTHKGTSTELKEWLPIDSLYSNAKYYFKEHISNKSSKELEESSKLTSPATARTPCRKSRICRSACSSSDWKASLVIARVVPVWRTSANDGSTDGVTP